MDQGRAPAVFSTPFGIPIELEQGDGQWTARSGELGIEKRAPSADKAMKWLDSELTRRFDEQPGGIPDWAGALVSMNRRVQVLIEWYSPSTPQPRKSLVAGRGEDVDRLVKDMARAGAKPKRTPWEQSFLHGSVETMRSDLEYLLGPSADAERADDVQPSDAIEF